jgi:hypothetical protein
VVVASDGLFVASDAGVLGALLSTGVVVEVSATGGVDVASVERGADDVASSWADAKRISNTLANPAARTMRPIIPAVATVFVFMHSLS